jgi:tRNA (guanine37-N1)-methyltransferase
MLMKADVLYAAWKSVFREEDEKIRGSGTRTLLLSPQGRHLDQHYAKELASCTKLILVCGHYEGVDQRFIDVAVDEEVSIGDYILTGGELPALVLADVVTRLIPGVVGNSRSISQDSLEKWASQIPSVHPTQRIRRKASARGAPSR